MNESLPASARIGFMNGESNGSWAREVNLLLVSRSPSWFEAVAGATRTLGHSGLHACDAQDALARLAGMGSRYSHLLVDANDADGLFNELADITTETRAPDTNLLLLGAPDSRHPSIRSIATATTQSVLEALAVSVPRREKMAMALTGLRAALQGAMIETRYQPIVRVADHQPVGLEALVRLKHPEQGIVSPDLFVPQLEAAGLAGELTSLVSARAFADLNSASLNSGTLAGHPLRMSINVPLDVVLTPDALDRLDKQRQDAGLAASRIIIELTESQPADQITRLGRALERLRDIGYGIAIDDVGPDMPHLSALLALPFTSLKLDKNLVRQMAISEPARTFLTETVERARARGLCVVAEGVETQMTWNHIAALGVDQVQGFLAARPLAAGAVPIWWAAWTEKHKRAA